MENNKKIAEIKKTLPRGSYAELAKRTGLSARTVYNVLEGKRCTLYTLMKVVKEAEILMAEYKEVMGE